MSSSPSTTTLEDSALEQLSLQVVAAMASAIALLIFIVVQLLYRSTTRHSRLITVQRRLRFDAKYIMRKPGTLTDRLSSDSLKAREMRETLYRFPPQAVPRVLPTVYDMRDAKGECKRILSELRAALGSTFGGTTNMTMRAALQCIQGALNPADVEKFAYIYDAVLFGVHRADGTVGDVTAEDMKFLSSYFVTIMKEL